MSDDGAIITNADLLQITARLEAKVDALASEFRHEYRNQATVLASHDEEMQTMETRTTALDLRLTTLERDQFDRITKAVEMAIQVRDDEERKERQGDREAMRAEIRSLFSYKRLVALAGTLAAVAYVGQQVASALR